jgi:hypothetical protein
MTRLTVKIIDVYVFLFTMNYVVYILYNDRYYISLTVLSSIGHEYEFKLNRTLDRLGLAYIGNS